MSSEIQEEFRRYAELIGRAVGDHADAAFQPRSESETAVQVERGAVYAAALQGAPNAHSLSTIEPLIHLTSGGEIATVAVVDESGHHRPVYRPLMVYGWLQTFRLWYELLPQAEFGRWDEALRGWCDLLEAELGAARIPEGGTPASRGDVVTESAWMALALFSAGRLLVRDAWTDLASDAFGRLTRGQTSAGTFLIPGPSDNPETWWYYELVLLHAAASYAVQAEDRTVAAAVARATEHHLREIQPDHATAQPWALFPFIWNQRTRPLADQLLHAVTVSRPDSPNGVSLILLADALYCLRLFERPGP
jgi:hypothetical protein